jgi:diguanylate cyclase (GGDEF)-like protein
MDILTKTASSPRVATRARPIRAILIEQNHDDALMVRALASDAGEEYILIDWADSLASGLGMIKKSTLDLVLVGISLCSSLENLTSLLERSSGIPVVAVGNTEDESVALTAVQAGVQDVLSLDHIDGFHFIRSLRYAVERQNIVRTMERSRTLERYLAYHDTLTKLPNRHLFIDRLVQSLALARRNDNSVAVLFIDLDGFKSINDTLGHSTGDLLLMSVADRLRGCIRESETASRFGGDEFAVILSDIESDQDAAIVAQRILDAFKSPVYLAGRETYVGTSIGISIYPSDGSNAEALVRNADTAMYLAKGDGGHQYIFYTPSMRRGMPEEPAQEKNIRKALEREQFLLHFQPQLDLHTGTIDCVEALIRWEHPSYGIIQPEQFIPAAEKSGLIVPIGEYVLLRACEQSRKWQKRGLPPVRIAVNLSMRQLRHHSLLTQVNRILSQTHMDPTLLGLEITENSAIHRCEDTVHLLESLKGRGIQLSIDDFGIGYSSLGYLKRLPVHMLKIDRSFVVGMTGDSDDVAIVKAIIAMAHSLGIRVTAEGVETREQQRILSALNCDAIQGYYVSKPVPAKKIEKLLERYSPRTSV